MIPLILLSIPNEGDRGFATGLFLRHGYAMLQAAVEIVEDRSTAEDMVSEACVQLVRNLPTLRGMPEAAQRSYLTAIVRNLSLSYVSKRNRRSRYSFLTGDEAILDGPADDAEIDSALIREAHVEELNRALEQLPPRMRVLLKMKYYEQQTDAEIAECLGISAASVRSYLTRARRALRELLEGRL